MLCGAARLRGFNVRLHVLVTFSIKKLGMVQVSTGSLSSQRAQEDYGMCDDHVACRGKAGYELPYDIMASRITRAKSNYYI